MSVKCLKKLGCHVGLTYPVLELLSSELHTHLYVSSSRIRTCTLYTLCSLINFLLHSFFFVPCSNILLALVYISFRCDIRHALVCFILLYRTIYCRRKYICIDVIYIYIHNVSEHDTSQCAHAATNGAHGTCVDTQVQSHC